MAWIYHITDASGGQMSGPDMENNADQFINYFSGYMSAAAMAGILGNMQHESYLNPGQCQIGSGVSTSSQQGGGLIQWTPRSAFIQWANARGYDWYDGDAQCYRIKCEGERTDGCGGYWIPTQMYPYSWSQFCALTDWQEATRAYLAERERAGVSALSLRLQYAEDWYDYIDGGVPIPTPSPTPPDPEPSPYEVPYHKYGGVRDLMRRGVISNGKL